MIAFDRWFGTVAGAGVLPHGWQRELAREQEPRSRLIRIPTGMGKTLGVLAAWAWHRLRRNDLHWPRRLIWCLPMRVLVEQTEAVVRAALSRMELLWDPSQQHSGRVGVHLLMGGTDPGGDWNLYPEECAVFIGTQDMLLSRALNRGYGSGRARWPLELGLLGHDALWVMDEVQLMDVGLATSGQLQAYHDGDTEKGFRPRHTWWMSATLQPTWLKSVDTTARWSAWCSAPTEVPKPEREGALSTAAKRLDTQTVPTDDVQAFAEVVLGRHAKLVPGDHGRITLVMCNTVDRACETYAALKSRAPAQDLRLVHGRFRAADRAGWREGFLGRAACNSGVDRILVATQVVEAGVDISAGTLVTELAPWPSLVQRFGRCARYGGEGSVLVVDRGRDESTAQPYSPDELEAAWAALERISASAQDVGLIALESFEERLTHDERAALYPYRPAHLLLRREFEELFDTTPDLSGADLDISRFIRTGEERDVLVFWRHIPPATKEAPRPAPPKASPSREELCPVPFLRARDWLCGEETTKKRCPNLKPKMRAWTWDWLDGCWVIANRANVTPGRIVCVASDSGGYEPEVGFAPGSTIAVPPVARAKASIIAEAEERADNAENAEDLSVFPWKTIGCHGGEVAAEADAIAAAVGLPDELRRLLKLAGLWHDLGKAHPAFQGMMRGAERPPRVDLAKAPDGAWLRPPGTYRTLDDKETRPGLRHELASALALFSVLERHAPEHPALLGPFAEAFELLGKQSFKPTAAAPPSACEQAVIDCSAEEFDLLVYLVACHHGKVRVALHAGPKDQEYHDPGDGRGLPIRGVREGDELPSVVLDPAAGALPPLRLSLEPASLGLSSRMGRSWRERTLDLTERFGPSALAWLEALIIAADRRASRLNTPDPALVQGGAR
jgi:CRISPR-associated endonuclease/helicase Cas3